MKKQSILYPPQIKYLNTVSEAQKYIKEAENAGLPTIFIADSLSFYLSDGVNYDNIPGNGLQVLIKIPDKINDSFNNNLEKNLIHLCYNAVHEIYGKKLPPDVENRLESELNFIKNNNLSCFYMLLLEFIKISKKSEYHAFFRATCGSSYILYLLGITETNPLPAHYICRNCERAEFDIHNIHRFNVGDLGIDLPGKKCPFCGKSMTKCGFNLPAEPFLGSNFDSFRSCIDVNFAREYFPKILCDFANIDRIGQMFYSDKMQVIEEIIKIIGYHSPKTTTPQICVNQKQDPSLSFLHFLSDTTGVNPKDIPMDDKKILSLFSSTEGLGITSDHIQGVSVGTLGTPDVGSFDTIKILELIRPKRYSDILKVINMVNGTNVWEENSEFLIRDHIVPFSDCISSREDIMLYLLDKGINRESAFKIMECVRKGKAHYLGLKEEWINDMKKAGIPEWYINSCHKVFYLVTKTDSSQRLLLSWKFLYYKLYFPEIYYNGWLNFYAHEVGITFIKKGYENARKAYYDLLKQGIDRRSGQPNDLLNELLVVMEMYARNIILKSE
ncbi:DNA polymerase III alpha subunit [Lachnospiraceae bacterium]|nr:DNA polymerase III alpha subunit [Lachnospiraceae bacterium]